MSIAGLCSNEEVFSAEVSVFARRSFRVVRQLTQTPGRNQPWHHRDVQEKRCHHSDLKEQSPSDFPAPSPDYSEDGIDLSLVRWMLSLTPAARLRFLDEHIHAIEAIRQLNAPK